MKSPDSQTGPTTSATMRGAPTAASRTGRMIVMRVVKGRPDQIVHAGIDDDEGLGLAALHVEHARDQDAGIADDQPARLENKPAIEIARRALDDGRIGIRIGRRLVVLAIGNAEPAAEIDVADLVTVGAQHAHEIGEQRERVAERIELGDLAADMHVDAGDAHALKLGGARINVARAADRNAEFVLGLAGGDLGVGLGIDVRIDADRDVGGAALAARRSRRAVRAPASDSTLTQRMPCSTASASSRSVLPTPENMIFCAGTPAARARNSSPSETTSAPAPSRASVAITA